MRRAPSLFLVVPCLGLLACTGQLGSGDAPPPATGEPRPAPAPSATFAPSTAKGLTIGTVQTHDAKVAILTSLNGELRVVVRKTDGALVADGITVDELRTTDPLLHAIVRDAVASRGAKSSSRPEQAEPYLDATLDSRARALGSDVRGGPARLR